MDNKNPETPDVLSGLFERKKRKIIRDKKRKRATEPVTLCADKNGKYDPISHRSLTSAKPLRVVSRDTTSVKFKKII